MTSASMTMRERYLQRQLETEKLRETKLMMGVGEWSTGEMDTSRTWEEEKNAKPGKTGVTVTWMRPLKMTPEEIQWWQEDARKTEKVRNERMRDTDASEGKSEEEKRLIKWNLVPKLEGVSVPPLLVPIDCEATFRRDQQFHLRMMIKHTDAESVDDLARRRIRELDLITRQIIKASESVMAMRQQVTRKLSEASRALDRLPASAKNKEATSEEKDQDLQSLGEGYISARLLETMGAALRGLLEWRGNTAAYLSIGLADTWAEEKKRVEVSLVRREHERQHKNLGDQAQYKMLQQINQQEKLGLADKMENIRVTHQLPTAQE